MQVTKEQAKENLIKLVEKFEQEFTSGRTNDYNEEATKTAFIQPFLKDVLGWDVNDNSQVGPEHKVSRGRVDYSLKTDGAIRMFVEAKAVKADLDKHIEQAVRYGYNRKDVSFVLLTDFEGIKLFDVTVKPDARNPRKGLKLDYNWKEYVNNFDKIWLLSRESVINGELDKLLLQKAKDRQTVDKEILEDLKHWREMLAKDIYKHNPKLFQSGEHDKDAEYLKEITQRLLDRIIFIRFCEDRNLTARPALRQVFEGRADNIGAKAMVFLKEEFKHYNIIFDSDLFSKRDWEETLAIDFALIRDLILETYNPYLFDVIPLEVLGNIYEQYLGYTIRLTEQRVKYEEKPDVRKAGGVYYTPEYIVDYIVKNTVGKLLKELPASKIKKLRILDPACGSGSFLIRAYDEMLKYYQSQKKEKKLAEGQGKLDIKNEDSGARLSIHEKNEILKQHIFGVDIDEQAVEVTKLSLMLKMLEGENGIIFGRGVLPMLDKNIRCGNSLISGDTLELKKYFGDDWYKVKSFDWEERFPQIMREEGGFDVVIGNPPYGAEISDKETKYYEKKYKLHNTDTACLFIGLAFSLLKNKGINSFIIPKSFAYASNWENIRIKIFNGLNEIVDCRKVWKEVKLEQLIFNFIKGNKFEYYNSSLRCNKKIIQLDEIDKKYYEMFGFYLNGIGRRELSLGTKIKKNSISFSQISNIMRGQDIQEYLQSNNYAKDIYRCKSIGRYYIKPSVEGISKENYNKIKNDVEYMEKPKIVIQNIVAHVENPFDHIILMAAYDDKNIISLGSVGNIFLKAKEYDYGFLVGLLNSKIISWYAYSFIYARAIRTMRLDNYHLERMPFPKIDMNVSLERKRYEDVIELVQIITELNKKQENTSGSKREQIERQIQKTDREIDELVYKLYGITEEEKKIIEGENK